MTEPNAPVNPEVIVVTTMPESIVVEAPKKSRFTKKKIAVAGAATAAVALVVISKVRKANKETATEDSTEVIANPESVTIVPSDVPVSE